MNKKQQKYLINNTERLYIWSAFAMTAAVTHDMAKVVESLDGLRDGELERCIIGASKVIQHATAILNKRRDDELRTIDRLKKDNSMLLLRVDQLKCLLKIEFGVDVDIVDKRVRA